jgi:hypothetical protein
MCLPAGAACGSACAAHGLESGLSSFLEKQVGLIDVGKDADIAVWNRNMHEIPADDLRNLTCEPTLVAGKMVYRRAP